MQTTNKPATDKRAALTAAGLAPKTLTAFERVRFGADRNVSLPFAGRSGRLTVVEVSRG